MVSTGLSGKLLRRLTYDFGRIQIIDLFSDRDPLRRLSRLPCRADSL